MTKSEASKLVRAAMGLSEHLNEIDAQLRSIGDEDERRRLLKVLGAIMLDLDAGFIRPLVRQHPDLDPDRT